MDKKEILKKSRKEYLTLSELTTESARIIPYIADEQKRGKVAVYPDERTIRYYINEGLVDKPGKDKRFTYKHLLQILVIKYLQSRFLPLNQIKQIVNKLDEKDMEILLTEEEASFSKSLLKTLGLGLVSPIAGIAAGAFNFFVKSPSQKKKVSEKWIRIPVTDKIELNVKDDNLSGNQDEYVERLVARLRIYLQEEDGKRRDEK
jgi:DNA-binding transcriptional MerR regulator